jgi:hypothetical protein
MTRLQSFSLASLVTGLILAAFIVPWSLKSIERSAKLLTQQQEQIAAAEAPAPVATPDPQAVMARQYEAMQQRSSAEQAARIKAELEKVAIPGPKKPTVAPTPNPAYSIVPQGSPQLIPLEGWVDRPDKKLPGRVRTELMVRNVKPSARPHVAPRAPCLKSVKRPAERIERPYGWLAVPARTILVACGS